MIKKNRLILLLQIGVILFIFSCTNKQVKNSSEVSADSSSVSNIKGVRLLDTLQVDSFIARFPFAKTEKANLIKCYSDRKYRYLWFNKTGLIEPGNLFVAEINAAQSCLADTVPGFKQLNSFYRSYLTDTSGKRRWKNLELMLTTMFFKYARITWGGMGEDEIEDINYYISRKRVKYETLMDSVDRNPHFFAPNKSSYKQYSLLEGYLRKYRGIEKNKLWKTIVTNKKSFGVGDSLPEIKQIRYKLFLLGDLPDADTSNMVYDDELEKRVKEFQRRYGLKENGKLAKEELKLLNTSMKVYIEQILANMERARWLHIDEKGDHLLVNIPEFKLYAYEDEVPVWTCGIVAGTDSMKTIMFNGNLRYVVFAPYWTLPLSIVKRTMLPYWQKNPDSIKNEKEIEVIDAKENVIDATTINWKKYTINNLPYTFRQKPGPQNPLGKVKFLFPNNFSIYLHDTPWKEVFESSKRNFSHGCIRVGDATHLVKWLLRDDPAWTDKKIDEALNLTNERYYTLKKEVPVFIAYFTAWVDDEGKLNFRDDLYGHDERLLKTLLAND